MESTNDEAVILVTASAVCSIVEGEYEVSDAIGQQASEGRVVLLKSAMCDGLRRATRATASGLHELGRLVALVSDLRNWPEVENEYYKDKPSAPILPDAILSTLIGVIGESDDLSAIELIWTIGAVPKVTDAAMIAALLSTRAGDVFFLETFARFVMIVFVQRDDAPVDERSEWSVSDDFVSKLRAKALQTTDGESDGGPHDQASP